MKWFGRRSGREGSRPVLARGAGSPGMLGASFDADSMDVTGALTGAAISETDLLAGRWDGARVSLFAVNWRDTADRAPLGWGTIGAVETREGMLTAELRGAAAELMAPVTEATSPECRAELGDRRCRVAMASRVRMARVAAAEDTVLTLAGEPMAPGSYANGRVRWLSGANCGLEDAVRASDETSVTLRRAPRFAAGGALVELREGCDKSIATCAGRFGNAANFRGEPYLPGIDLLTRYPGA